MDQFVTRGKMHKHRSVRYFERFRHFGRGGAGNAVAGKERLRVFHEPAASFFFLALAREGYHFDKYVLNEYTLSQVKREETS